jgi:hypothetical protein
MKKTLQDQYLLIKEGKGHKGVFLSEAKRQFPNIVRNAATFEEAAASLITKNIISENVIGTSVVAGYEPRKKESYETAFEDFLAEARKKVAEDEKVKAEEKKVSKPVEEDLSHNFDYTDEKNPDNMIFGQIMMGYYAEMKDPKNSEKTMQELKDMVFKNLAKDPIYYTKNAQFGVKDLGYTDEATALGEPKEAKGKYKSSGYGDLKEGIFDRFKSKPLGDVENTKKETIKNFKSWLKKNAYLPNVEDLTDDKVIVMVKDFAKKNPTNTIHQLWNQSKHLFEVNEPVENLKSDVKKEFEKKSEKKFTDEEIKAKLKKKREEELKRRKEAGEPLEEIKLRKVIQEIIDAELEEAYQLKNINLKATPKDREERDPQDFFTVYLKQATEDLLKKNQHLRVLKDPQNPDNIKGVAIRSRFIAPQNLKKLPYDINPMFINFLNTANNIGGEISLPTREGVMDTYTLLNNVNVGRDGRLSFKIPNPKAMPKMEGLMESVEKDLADINKEAEHEVLQSKLDKIDALIDNKKSKLSKLDEDEDMKALTDKKKVKELEKDIKKLEQARAKVEKMMSKFKGKKSTSKEVIDEMEDEPSEEYLKYKEDAEKRYEDGQSIDSIINGYSNISLSMKDTLRNDLEAKFEGTDNE